MNGTIHNEAVNLHDERPATRASPQLHIRTYRDVATSLVPVSSFNPIMNPSPYSTPATRDGPYASVGIRGSYSGESCPSSMDSH